MNKFQTFIEEKLLPLTASIGEQRHLQAVRDGIIQTLPLILIGSFFLLLGQPPGDYLMNLVKPYATAILIPYRLTFGLIAIYVAVTVAYSLARSYKMDGITTGILSAVTFFMLASPRVLQESGTGKIMNLHKGDMGWDLPMKYFGTDGLFLAIITALLVVELLRFLKSRKLMITMPDGVPEGVTRAFEAIIPSFLIITAAWILRDILKIDAPALVIAIFSPVKTLGDSVIAVIVLSLIDSVVWFAGIHPVAIIGPFARPIWLTLLTENADAMITFGPGKVLPHIAVDQFYFWFMWVGGSGATIGLVIQLLSAKSKFLRQLGKMCLLPGIFNINEPLVFGLPIVANPLMIIPFTLAPLIGGLLSYGAFALNMVQRPYLNAPWTLPAPLGALVSTGGDWRAFVLSVIVILISGAVYYPFLKTYDAQMLAREIQEENNGNETDSNP